MTKASEMCPRAGDTIELYGEPLGQLARRGKVLEVTGTPGRQRFRVLWEDGRVTVLDPSSDATIVLRAGR
jgi:uncharacterized protein DUF1918